MRSINSSEYQKNLRSTYSDLSSFNILFFQGKCGHLARAGSWTAELLFLVTRAFYVFTDLLIDFRRLSGGLKTFNRSYPMSPLFWAKLELGLKTEVCLITSTLSIASHALVPLILRFLSNIWLSWYLFKSFFCTIPWKSFYLSCAVYVF